MAEDVVLFSVLKLAGKPLDVTLSSRTISWVASATSTGSSGGGYPAESRGRADDAGMRQGSSMMLPYIYIFSNEKTTETSETAEVHHYHFVKLCEVITAAVDSKVVEDNNAGSSAKPRKLDNHDDLTFAVHCVRRNSQGKWRVRELKFECLDQETCQRWVAQIRDRIVKQGYVRPQNLLVFINPFGGKREAGIIYDTHTAPLFNLAGIKTTIIYTEAKNHARDVMLKRDLSEFDGVVCVGGDGTFAEVVNGLLVRTQQEGGVDYNDPETTPQCPLMRIGVIPAGSTDVIVCDTTGVNDPVTSTLQIVLGCSLGLDICSVHSSHHQLLRYAVSFMGYGFFGDVLKESENHRWMGPYRYDFAGFKKYFGNKSYSGEVSFLTSADEDHHPQDKTKCRVGCAVCLRRSDSQTSDDFDLDSSMGRLDLQDDDTSLVNNNKGGWRNVTGSFCAVNAALVSGSNRLSPNGIAPSSHLGNGCLDLLLVHKCSRFNFLRHLIRIGNSGNHFNFDFVEVHRVKEFTFRSLSSQDLKSTGIPAGESTFNTSLVNQPQVRYQATGDSNTSFWNMDGEVGDIPDINVHVHCQLIKIFAYGREDPKALNASCCMSRSQTKNKTAWR